MSAESKDFKFENEKVCCCGLPELYQLLTCSSTTHPNLWENCWGCIVGNVVSRFCLSEHFILSVLMTSHNKLGSYWLCFNQNGWHKTFCFPLKVTKFTWHEWYSEVALQLKISSFSTLCVAAEVSLQAGPQRHARLDRPTEPSLQPAADRLPHPWERNGAGETPATPEAGDGGLEPRLLDQAERHLQQGWYRFFERHFKSVSLCC